MKLNDHLYFYHEHGMLDCNTYVVKDKLALIVDAGLGNNLPLLIKAMEKDGINPQEIDIIANTHLHIDHTWANEELKKKGKAKIKITQGQKENYNISIRQTSLFFGLEPVEFKEDELLDSPIDLGNIKIEIISTPGHSPESVCFYVPESKALICGDLVFDRNTGRSDLPGGNGEQLKKSIEKVAELDLELLLPGHMGIVAGKKKVNDNFEFLRTNVFRWL
jgi:glyoxylase-like metal-dependent hydrolase (beta-lactamase superfamily II)